MNGRPYIAAHRIAGATRDYPAAGLNDNTPPEPAPARGLFNGLASARGFWTVVIVCMLLIISGAL